MPPPAPERVRSSARVAGPDVLQVYLAQRGASSSQHADAGGLEGGSDSTWQSADLQARTTCVPAQRPRVANPYPKSYHTPTGRMRPRFNTCLCLRDSNPYFHLPAEHPDHQAAGSPPAITVPQKAHYPTRREKQCAHNSLSQWLVHLPWRGETKVLVPIPGLLPCFILKAQCLE